MDLSRKRAFEELHTPRGCNGHNSLQEYVMHLNKTKIYFATPTQRLTVDRIFIDNCD